MKRFLSILLVLLPCIGYAQYSEGYSELYESERVSAMKEHVGYLASVALEGRAAGSEGEKDAAVYFREALQKCGVDVLSDAEGDLFGLKQESGDTLTSRNVIGFIPGFDSRLKNHYIVIGARLDNVGVRQVTVNGELRENVYCGANGNASGLAMLLELARMLSECRVLLDRSVIIAAFGASLEMQAGSWYFLNRSFADSGNIDAMINLDMLGTASNGFFAFTSCNPDMNARVAGMAATLQPVQAELINQEPFASDHRSFYNSEIPSVTFTTGLYPEYNTPRDTPWILDYDGMDKETEYLFNFAVALSAGPAPSFRNETAVNDVEDAVPYYECDVLPSFMGSTRPDVFLKKWVYTYLRYPKAALEQGIQGRVLVGFTITGTGKVTDVKVLRSVHPLLDEEAVRVISASPDWKPGKIKDRKVKSTMSTYVEFRLQKK